MKENKVGNLNKSSNKIEYKGIDIVKFIMAIIVVACHTHLYSGNNQTILSIYNIFLISAVPFFFLSSGFFLYKNENQIERIESNLKKIIKLYLIWNIIYFPISIYDYFVQGYSVWFSILHYIRGVLLIGEHFYSWPLWYLLSLIYSYIGLIILKKMKLSDLKIFFITLLIYIFSIVMDALLVGEVHNFFVDAFDFVFSTSRLFTGIFLVFTGMMIKKHQCVVSKKKLVALITICAIILFLYYNRVVELVFNICIFLLVIQLNNVKFETIKFRKCNTIFYFLHMINLFIYRMIVGENRVYGVNGFLVVIIACSIEAAIIIYVQNKGEHKILNELFN